MFKILKEMLLDSLTRSAKVVWMLVKIMFPVALVFRLLKMARAMPYIGDVLSPLMQWVGLPGEMGLVWAVTLLVNVYGGIFTYLTLLPTLAEPLSVAQVTVLTTVMLIAHTFPAELTVARKCGVRLWFAFSMRFFMALLAGVLLNLIYHSTGWLAEPSHPIVHLDMPDATWGLWLLSQLRNFALIFVVVFSMVLLIKILDKIKVLQWVNKALYPLVEHLGIGINAVPSVLVGLTMGLAYGGGIILAEAEERQLSQADLLYSLVFLGLCHSIIEDTLLMMSCGAHYSGVLIFRVLFALIVCRIFILITRRTGIRWLVVPPAKTSLPR